MVKHTKIMVLPLLLVALIMGCSQDEGQFNAPIGPSGNLAASISSLSALTIQSATLRVSLSRASGNEVTLHNVAASWDEMTVTYNSFGGAFDGVVIGSYNASTIGYQYIDITSQVTSWLNGSVANNGVLFKHADITYPIDAFLSREYDSYWDVLPKLEICYMTPEGVECSSLIAIADTYITELEPDNNFGLSDELYIGYYLDTPLKKQVLIRFDIPSTPPPLDGCTRTIGYWYNWGGFGPQEDIVTALLPQWLGTPGGSKSIFVDNGQLAHDLLGKKVYGNNSNGITKLYAQLMAAKLNFAHGASSLPVDGVVLDTDAFLADHDYLDWKSLDDDTQELILYWHKSIDDYNNGYLGVPHCEDPSN